MSVPDILRELMVELQLFERGITDDAVLTAFEDVPRDRFVDEDDADVAYDDCALPLGITGEAISDPYATAWLLQAAEIRPGQRVLDVGTGSGYLAALAAHMGALVHTVERNPELVARAAVVLAALAPTVTVHHGDGWDGLPSQAPFDRVVVGCAAPEPSPHWLAQLAPDGLLVAQVGAELAVITADGTSRAVGPAGFAPLAR